MLGVGGGVPTAHRAPAAPFTDAPPRGAGPARGGSWLAEIPFLVVMALYAAAILWMTSQRSRIAPPPAPVSFWAS